MKFISLVGMVILLTLAPVKGFAQSCHFSLGINYPNGQKGCLTDLPISKIIDKVSKKPISEIASSSEHYAIASSSICNFSGVGTAPRAGIAMSIATQKEKAKQQALNQCPKNCECAIVVDDGSVLVPQNLASLIGVGSDTVASNLNSQGQINTSVNSISNLAKTENNKSQETEKQRQLADTDSKEREKQLLAAVEEQKQKALLAKQEAEKLALLASNEVSERQKDRELLLQLSAELARLKAEHELAKLKAEQHKNLQQVESTQSLTAVSKIEPAKSLPIFANRKALVIGNDEYKFVSKLFNAKQDANSIAENLIKVGYKVTLKLDQSEKEMKASLRNFKGQVEAGDEVAIFYAGHGVQLSNTNYLLPVDVAGDGEEQIKDEAISLQRILDDMSDKKVKFTLAMIDACRDNPFKSSGRSIGGGARGLAPTTAATGQMIVFSAGTGQQSLDKLGPNDKDKNGLFTRLFIKEMQKTGVTIDQLVRSVRNEVVMTAKSVGHDQVPAIYDQVVGEFYFRK